MRVQYLSLAHLRADNVSDICLHSAESTSLTAYPSSNLNHRRHRSSHP